MARRTKTWNELADDAEWLAQEIGEADEAARDSALFVALRCRRLALRPPKDD